MGPIEELRHSWHEVLLQAEGCKELPSQDRPPASVCCRSYADSSSWILQVPIAL